ncbi:X-ray repair cross-complementing protein 6 isoform X1 [Neodiprion fabricii]|uniref:X-ray repair cross-complementing protein 6 isoform X1 n=2 Tax=Neodiprion fabricii TaxID=2872261 RepID=UPI001ED8EB9D|nr:X-ray repair cross-complementing protein 6 isoform X1 [Neodiprion fabricii]XP_046429050.1 X-ray repair cross-complementing protein 6 isoform X1 [Neodiprion fabricii]
MYSVINIGCETNLFYRYRYNNKLHIENLPESEESKINYCSRDGVIFIIDATKEMFEIDPEHKISYFSQCLEAYKNILAEKLSWNKTDWMGIILMGTNKWDQDPEIKHVFTWLTFKEVSIDQMTKIDEALLNVDKFHDDVGSSTEYPLYDALWHATRCFNAVKITMPFRHIVLLTRSDNPYANDHMEKHRIRLKVDDCSNMNIRFSVVGLGKKWNPSHFFDELEVHSGKFDKAEDYERTLLTDLEEEIKHASRITAKLQWTLGNGVKLGVSVSTITAKTKFPRQIRLSKVNNEPLDAYSYYRKAEAGYSEDEEDTDENEESIGEKVVLSENVYNYQEFGGRSIRFSLQESSKLSNSREPGITLLGFKPISKLDLSHHLEAPNFVTYNESQLQGSKALFAALLNQCDAKDVMAICVVTLRSRSPSYLYALIPSVTLTGFYAYKLPFAENVRDFSSVLSQYYYNDTDNKCPINNETVDLCYNFIKKTSIKYDPVVFKNPKLHTELAHIESLAMDKDSCEIPFDTTIPDKEAASHRLGQFRVLFKNEVDSHGETKNTNKRTLNFEELVQAKQVKSCTVAELKDYLKSVGKNPVGRKNDLVDQVYSLFT